MKTLKVNAIGIPALGEASAKQTNNKSDSGVRNRNASTTVEATNRNENMKNNLDSFCRDEEAAREGELANTLR